MRTWLVPPARAKQGRAADVERRTAKHRKNTRPDQTPAKLGGGDHAKGGPMSFKATPGWVKGRQLTAGERDEARHMLQALFEGARLVRNHIEPQTGALGLSVGHWLTQWGTLKRDLDSFTERLTGKPVRDVRYHSSDEMDGLSELRDLMAPVTVILRPDGSVDVYGHVGIVDQRAE
jgi:hypothetical protein